MSKVFSLAGLRLGWIATHDKEAVRSFLSHRDYNLISCGMFDEAIATVALRHSEKLLERNRNIVRENLKILTEWIESEPHVEFVNPQAGTTALVYYDLPVDSYDLCERMYKATGAFVTPGDCFEEPRSMRIGYACDSDTLKKGLNAISADALVAGDDQKQCSEVGECEKACKSGLISGLDAEIGEIITGKRGGRASDAQITVFDSTGIALQDLASAAAVIEKAVKAGAGIKVEL